MLKSGLITGAIAIFLAAGFSLISPICVPCIALLLGAGAGYLNGVFDRPSAQNSALKAGAGSGAIGGGGALVGHLIGGALNAVVVGPESVRQMLEQFGLSASDDPVVYYGGVFGGACCLGLFEIVLMAGLGALGGLLWWQMTGKNMAGGAPSPPPMPGV